MKNQMSSFDIAAVVGELQPLVGLKVEKVFFPSHHELFFRLTAKKEKKTIFIRIGQALWLEDGFRQADPTPPTFAMLLRKHLSGLKLRSVEQHGFDRVVVFEFDSAPVIKLVAEMFGTGNVILVEGDKIIQPLTSRSWRGRDVKAGQEFRFPPVSTNPFELDAEGLTAILKDSEKDLVRCLAVNVNLGGAYAEEVCKVIGKNKNEPANSMGLTEVKRILEIIALFGESLKQPSPFVVLEEGQPTDVQPFWLSIYADNEKTEYETFSLAAAEYFSSLPVKVKKEKIDDSRRARLERQIERQKAAVEKLGSESKRFQEAGDLLYANFQEVNDILESIKIELSEGNWQEAKRSIETMERVEDFNPSKGVFILNLSDGVSVRMDVRLNFNDNAAILYSNAKKARHKQGGAQEALAETETELQSALDVQEKEEARHRARKKPTKKLWFEKFRWFVSSDGNLVLGGRDARTNDQVVKKHLKQNDLYAHADLHGAPSVVIKEGSEAEEQTLTEACIFALCFSKAWKSKSASGSAYWVKPDQVSKSPEPGEFLARGAFVIRGKRNYSKKLDMKLAVGEVLVEGERKVMCAPESALAAQSGVFFLIMPGDEKRASFAKKLSDYYNIPIEEIDRILPPGDVKVLARP